MSMGKRVLVVFLCGQLVGVCWGQETSAALDFLSEGIAAYETEQWQACADALEKAIAKGFSNPLYRLDALVFLGRTYARLGHQERALAYFKEVLKLQPDYWLDPADPAGLKLFRRLLGEEEEGEGKLAKEGGFPTGKAVVGVGGMGVIAVIIFLLTGGGGGTEGPSERPIPPPPEHP